MKAEFEGTPRSHLLDDRKTWNRSAVELICSAAGQAHSLSRLFEFTDIAGHAML